METKSIASVMRLAQKEKQIWKGRRITPAVLAACLCIACGMTVVSMIERKPYLYLVGAAMAVFVVIGIIRKHPWISFLATLIPTAAAAAVGNPPDTWYFGLLIFCWCGLYAGIYKKEKDYEYLEGENGSGYLVWLLIIAGICILLYLILFQPEGFAGSALAEKFRQMTASLFDALRGGTSGSSGGGGGGGNAAENTMYVRTTLAGILQKIISITLFLFVLLFAIYESFLRIRMYRRRKRWQNVISDESVYDIYRYMVQVCAFDGIDINCRPYRAEGLLAAKYGQAAAGEGTEERMYGFRAALCDIEGLKYGGCSLSKKAQHEMAAYASSLSKSIYRSQTRRKKIRFRLWKGY